MKQIKSIGSFKVSDIIPVINDVPGAWRVKLSNRECCQCNNVLSPNRRDFYWVLLLRGGSGIFTLGQNTYYVDQPALLFIHPSDIISWKNMSPGVSGYDCFFTKEFINKYQQLKAVIEKYGLFINKHRNVITLSREYMDSLDQLFLQMQHAGALDDEIYEDVMQAYLQLLMIQSVAVGKAPQPESVCNKFKYVQKFFDLLDREMANINYINPIRIKTVKEFAAGLAVHPNHLNALMKRHTGHNVSSHIRTRLLEECKVLLRQTDWSLQDISLSIGFAEQSNFNFFFKKNTGLTPSEFRKTQRL